MTAQYKIVTYSVDANGTLFPSADYSVPSVTTAMSRAGELSGVAAGAIVLALWTDGSEQVLATYGQISNEYEPTN